MCLYTKYIENPKYKSNKKNGGNPPPLLDKRLQYVPVSCGRCIECRRKKQREWIIRLSEEIRENKGLFITLTIDNKSFNELRKIKEESENDIATKALRRFLERIRKDTKKSIRHWAITELGEERGRIHIHGIFWCNPELIKKHWKYGFIFIGQFVNEKTIFYITKYMTKQNEKDKNFIGKVLCSSGIGANYIKREDAKNNKYKEGETKEQYRLKNGMKIGLPDYYRHKLYNEEEREKLWIEKQEQGYRYVCGEKVSTENISEWENLTKFYQEQAIKIHGDNPIEWEIDKVKKRLQRLAKYRKEIKGFSLRREEEENNNQL